MKKNDIQIKFKIVDVDVFLEKLRKNKYILIRETFEKTTRYDFEDERLARQGIFIRTKNGFDDTITIKEKTPNKTQKKYFERENATFEIENCDSMKYLLEKIGLTKTYIMEKYRIIWKKGEVELHLDELPFGIYCEVCSSEKEIDKIVNRLGVDTIYNCTYWEIYNQIEDDKKDIKFEKDHIFLTDSLI